MDNSTSVNINLYKGISVEFIRMRIKKDIEENHILGVTDKKWIFTCI